MSNLTPAQVQHFLDHLTAPQLVQLTKELEKKWGVSATPTIQSSQPAPEDAPLPPVEKTEFTVVLTLVPPAAKMATIKELRVLTGLGLKEAKDMAERAPTTIKEDVPKEEAEKMQKALETAGAKVELK
jgi:large subunit ribosomal protein L7/L12